MVAKTRRTLTGWERGEPSQTGPVDYTLTACVARFSMIMGTSLLPITDVAIITAREAPSGVITRRMTIPMRDFSLPSVRFQPTVTPFGDVKFFYFTGVHVKSSARRRSFT